MTNEITVTLVTQNADDLCPKCGRNPAEKDHTCPYAEDIYDDHESLCDCCSECARECAMDI